ncbi:MAG: BON domain-containing protein [Chloroflexi bacterium]|nr:BON domain-containing protein [Chloroflexota bacterium]
MAVRLDDEIERDVVDALLGDVRLDITDLNVEVQRGTVVLRGAVSNLFQHHLAEHAAGRIKGVTKVINDLAVAPMAIRPDIDIAADVAATLLRDTWIDGHGISVRVERGVIFLDGVVDSYVERASAEDDARTVRGVKKIVNGIDIAPGPTRHDEEMASDIRLALLRELRLGRSEIDVSVKDGMVRVRGSVWSIGTRRAIEEIVRRTQGVKGVLNEVKVVA